MPLTVLLVVLILMSAALVAYMATHMENATTRIEREACRICHEAERGWSMRRILRHHRRFCRCQVEYLTSRRRLPV